MMRPTRAEIDTEALQSNVGVLRSHLPPGTEMMAVVKADCYGHSTAICVPELLSLGITRFAVATVQEGGSLRDLGLRERITLLAPPLEGEYAEIVARDLEPLISSLQMARHLSDTAAATGRLLRSHLFVDTGMARNGMAPADVVESLRSIQDFAGLDLVGICSHFACSDEPENPFNREQITRFGSVLQATRDAGFAFDDVHLANSGGVLHFPESHHTLVRPGLALYGYHPTPAEQVESGLRPVMRLRTIVANIWKMPAGRSISYGRRYFTRQETYIASLPIGYADGLMRSLTNRMEVLIGGRRRSCVGTICMDEVMVDLGDAEGIAVGDEVIVIGHQGGERIDAWELAESAGTIPYEICTGISARVPRVISSDSEQTGNRTGIQP